MRRWFLLLLGVARTVLAADVSRPAYEPPRAEAGAVRIACSPALADLAGRLAADFPGARVTIRGLGSDVAMAALYTGRADVALIGRPATEAEVKAYEWVFRVRPASVEVATGPLQAPGRSPPLVFHVHRDNPLSRLTLAQADAVFSPARLRGAPAEIRTWGDLGLGGEWTQQEIRLYAPDTESGTGRFLRRAVFGDSRHLRWEVLTEFADESDLTAPEHTADGRILDALARDRFGLAVSGAAPGGRAVRAVPLAAADGTVAVLPTPETVAARQYPLTRSILAYFHALASRPAAPQVEAFLRHVRGPAGDRAVVAAGFLPAPTSADAPRALRLASSATTDDLAETWSASLARLRPAEPAPVILRGRYPTDALEAVLAGTADAALCAREPYEGELATARLAGRGELRFIPVATGSRASRGGTHAIAIFVHASNPLDALSLPQLREMLAADGRARTWGDVGVAGPLAGRRIVVHGQPVRRASGNPPGIVNFLEGRVLAGRGWRGDVVAHDDQAGGPTALEAIVQAVARDPGAIGWSGFDYQVPGSKPLAIGSGADGPFLRGTDAEVAARTYPLTRLVYLCLPGDAAEAAAELARVILRPDSQAEIARSASGFRPLPEEMRAATLARLAAPLEPPRSGGAVAGDGRIRVVGYNDMREMVAGWTESFARDHPGFRFELDLPSTRAAVEAVASGRAAFGPMGAELSPSQLARFRELAGVEPWQIRVAHASLDSRALSGPLAILVHPSNARREISVPEVAAIFSGRAAGQGLEPIGLAAETALGLFFQERVLRGQAFGPAFQPQAQSAEVVRRVAANPRAIGFAAAVRVEPGVRALAVAPEEGRAAVALTSANLVSNAYPLDRSLWLLVRPPAAPWLREFLRLVLSEEGRRIVAEGSLGYLPLSVEDCQAELAKLR